MPSNRKLAFTFGVWIVALQATAAQAAAPVLIDGSEFGLRDDLAWLADRRRIDLGLTTWPQPLGVVERALDRISPIGLDEADRDALERARSALRRLQGDGGALGVRTHTARHPSAGADAAPRARFDAYAQLQGANEDSLAWRVRGHLQKDRISNDPSPASLDGSYLAYGGENAVLSLGAVDRWWGPGRYGSVVLGDAAPPVPALMLRRGREDAPASPWLAWIGPWTYEFSLGRPNHYEPRASNTIGMRLVARPLTGVEIGVARYIYWGGDGRPRSAKSLGKALLAHSNIDDPATQGPDPSNEIAGIDLRVALPAIGGVSAIGYVQMVGEDEAQGAPSKVSTTAGLQLKHASAVWRYDWTLEGSDTRLGRNFGLGAQSGQSAYQHSTYVAGHYETGLPVGAFIGGGGVSASLGLALTPLAASDERRYEARLWTANVSTNGPERINLAYGVPGTVKGALFRASGVVSGWRWSAGLSTQDYPESGRPRAGLVGSIEIPLDAR